MICSAGSEPTAVCYAAKFRMEGRAGLVWPSLSIALESAAGSSRITCGSFMNRPAGPHSLQLLLEGTIQCASCHPGVPLGKIYFPARQGNVKVSVLRSPLQKPSTWRHSVTS